MRLAKATAVMPAMQGRVELFFNVGDSDWFCRQFQDLVFQNVGVVEFMSRFTATSRVKRVVSIGEPASSR